MEIGTVLRNPIIADADTGHGGITATMKLLGRWKRSVFHHVSQPKRHGVDPKRCKVGQDVH